MIYRKAAEECVVMFGAHLHKEFDLVHTPHELAEDFPGQQEKIATLRNESAHFAKLSDDYHEVNRAIHRAETDVEPTDDLHMTELRKRRMVLKDEIAALLRA